MRKLPTGAAEPVKLPVVDKDGCPVEAKHIIHSPCQQACLVFFSSMEIPAKVLPSCCLQSPFPRQSVPQLPSNHTRNAQGIRSDC